MPADAAAPTVLSLAADLAAGRTTSRALVEAALARIADPAGEGKRTFIKVYARRRARAPPTRRIGCAAPAMSPRRSPGCRCRSRTCSMSPASARWPARRRSTTRRPPHAMRRSSRGCAAAGAVLDRPHQHDRIRLLRRRHQPALRHARQSLRPHAHSRRLVVGRGGLGGGRQCRRRDRHRYRRLGAHPGGAVRHRRVQADAEAHPARRRDAAVDDARFDRAARQQRRLLRHHRRGHGGRGAGGAGAAAGRRRCGSACRRLVSARRSRRRKWRAPSSAPAPRCRAPARGSSICRSPSCGEYAAINAKGGFSPTEAFAWHRDAAGAARRRIRSSACARASSAAPR